MNTEKRPYQYPEVNKEKLDIVDDYIQQLDLTHDDFQRKMLDVGGGLGKFAKKSAERDLSSKIYSIDPRQPVEGVKNSIVGSAEKLPFKDGEFELVVSNAAFPFFVLMDKEIKEQLLAGNSNPAKKKVKEVLEEMLRVLQVKGYIKLGRVTRENTIPHQKILESIFDQILEEMINNKTISKEEIPKGNLMDYRDSNKVEAKLSLIKLQKIS